MTAPSAQIRYEIIESLPDKNGLIIIAIKPNEGGKYKSRNEALDALRALHITAGERAEQVLEEIEKLPTHINKYESFSIPFVYKYEIDKMIEEYRQERKA